MLSSSRRIAPGASSVLVISLLSACMAHKRVPDGGLLSNPRTTDARFEAEVAQTASGLRYALVPDPRSNVVTVDVRYTVGAADDPAGKSGLAHLVEHVIFEHTAKAGGPSLSQRLDQAALGYNAYTNWDETHYTATATAANLGPMLALEAERMAPSCDRLSPEIFERERQVVLNESRQRADDVWRGVRSKLFGGDHPYARPVGGTDIASITRDDLCAFLGAHYAPSRAILVVVGPFDPANVRTMVERAFAGIQRTAATQRALPALTTSGESVHSADVDEPTAVIAFPAPVWGHKGNAARDLVIDLWIRRAQLTADTTGITGIRRGYQGGYRGGVDVITVTASHWSKLPGAVDGLFRAQEGILADDFALSRRDVRSTHANTHLTSLEQFSGLGIRVADFLQYADHPWFMVQPFNETDGLWPEGQAIKLRTVDGYQAPRLLDHADSSVVLATAIAGLPVRAATHVAWIQPDKSAPKMDPPPSSVPRVEVAEWKTPVDAADADRPVPVPASPPGVAPRRVTLPNGLVVVLAPIPTSPVVDIRVVFPTGTFSDPSGQLGLSVAAAELLTQQLPKGMTDEEFMRAFWALGLGTRMDADVDEDTTVFRASGAARYADWHLWRLFWLLDQGAYDADVLAKLAADAEPSDVTLGALVATALVGPTAVRVPDPTVFRRLTLRDLDSYRSAHYLPAGATLMITGGFDTRVIQNAIPKLWGQWRGKAPAVKYPKVTAAPTGQHQVAIDDPDARQLTVALAFPTASTDLASRLVVQEMVAAQVRAVRGRLGVTYGVDAEYEFLLDAVSTLLVTGEVDPARGGEAIKAMMAALDELRTSPEAFTRAFVAARKRVVGRMAVRISDTATLASELESQARAHWDREEWNDAVQKVAALTPAAARQVLASDMDRSKAVLALSGRRAVIEKACRDAGVPAPHFAPATAKATAKAAAPAAPLGVTAR